MKYQISEEALNGLVTILNEMPYKYTAPIIKILNESLQAIEPELKE